MNDFLEAGFILQLSLQESYDFGQVCLFLVHVSSLLFVKKIRSGLPRGCHRT